MKETQKRMAAPAERSIDVMRLLRAVLKRIWIILLISVVAAVVAFGYTKLFVTPTYRSSFTAYVNNRTTGTEGQSNMTSSDISASRNLTYLYQEIILSRSVLMDAAAACDLQVSYGTLSKNVNTSVSANAAIISVYVTAESPDEAVQLASAIASVAPDHVARVVDGSSMRIVDYPVKPGAPYAPNSFRNSGLAFIIALLATCCCVILFDVVADKVDSAAEMEDRYDIAVIGVIPDMQQAEKYQYGSTDTARRKSS